MTKPVVHYQGVAFIPGLGWSAIVCPVDHPDAERVSNTKAVLTSPVVAIHDDGFETENTRYVRS